MHAALALLAAALHAAPAMTDAEVRGRVEALLGAIDRPDPGRAVEGARPRGHPGARRGGGRG